MPETDGEFLSIDTERLDTEWEKQPTLFFDQAAALAEAKFAYAEAKANVDVVRAELGFKIRADPAKFKIPKITETTVNDRIVMHTRYKEAMTAMNAAKREVDFLQAAVDALDHRKKALESLVYLHGQNYNSAPRVKDPAAKEAMQERSKTKVRNSSPMKRKE